MGGAAAARAMAAVSRLTAEDQGATGTPPPSPCIQPDSSRHRAASSASPEPEALGVHACDSEDYEVWLCPSLLPEPRCRPPLPAPQQQLALRAGVRLQSIVQLRELQG